MRAIGRWGLCTAALVLALQGTGEAQTEAKNKQVRITNKQSAPTRVYLNFAADSVLKPTDLPFCEVTGPLNCQFTLAANSSKDVPNPQARYLNMLDAALHHIQVAHFENLQRQAAVREKNGVQRE